jgi:hypothetical protein
MIGDSDDLFPMAQFYASDQPMYYTGMHEATGHAVIVVTFPIIGEQTLKEDALKMLDAFGVRKFLAKLQKAWDADKRRGR